MTGFVRLDSNKGFVFLEADDTHQSVFCHISQVKDDRCLHTGDRVSFDIVPNPTKPGTMMAGNVVYLGRTIARQVSDRDGVR
jgi:cold shock CspA family protein